MNWTEVLEVDQNGLITQYEVVYLPLITFDVLDTMTVNHNKPVYHSHGFGRVCGIQYLSESLHQCGTWTIQCGDC